MELNIVVKQIGGFAREDDPVPSVVGAYSDGEVARKVARLSGFGAKVMTVVVDAIPPGIKSFADECGVSLESAPSVSSDSSSPGL